MNLPQFIGAYQIENRDICTNLIAYHANHPDKKPGIVVKTNGETGIDDDIKSSLEVSIPPNSKDEYVVDYFYALQKCLIEYIKQYPISNNYAPFTVSENIALVKFPKNNGGFKAFHTERCSGSLPNAARHLVFMTYLNDIKNGGETEFIQQNFICKPRKGLTLIWPADWTFTHRGLPSLDEDKYIISGWFSYY